MILLLLFASVFVWQIIRARSQGEVVALIIAAFGMGSFLAPSILNEYKPSWTAYIEFPNADAGAWMGDRSGHIYLGSWAFGRIQKYAADGRFERGWFVDVTGGAYSLSETSAGTILVCGARKSKSVEFTPEGIQVTGSDKPCDYGVVASRRTRDISTGFGVVNFTDDRNGRIVSIHAPIALLPLWSPFMAWLIFVIGCLLGAFARAGKL